MIPVSYRCISNNYLLIQRLSALLPKGNNFSYREINNTSLYAAPIKLAYASYESTKESSGRTFVAPIMIMHGLFGSKSNWNSLAKAIHQKTNRKVIAIDARNHGDSPHSSDVSYDYMAQDVVHLLKDLNIEKAILVGHSMGGSTMMYVALHYPELVEKLVVIDMSPIGSTPSVRAMMNIFQAMRSVTLEGSVSLSKARKMADEQLANVVHSIAIRQYLLTNLVEAETGKYKWRVNLSVLEQNFPTQIAVFPNVGNKIFNGPTLFLGGSVSDYIKIEDHAAIKKLFPAAEFHYVVGAGHWVHSEKPAEFLTTMTTFVNRLDQ